MGYLILQPVRNEELDARTKTEERLLKNQKDVVNEMTSLKNKISELEISLEQAEFRVPKTFPNVKFLNYKDRKRILVNTKQYVVPNFSTHFICIK